MGKLDDMRALGPPGLARQIVRGPGKVVTEAELVELRRLLAAKNASLGPPAVTPTKAAEQFQAALDSVKAATPTYVAGQKPKTGVLSNKAKLREAAKRGRKRVHQSDAERQAAYRARAKGKTT